MVGFILMKVSSCSTSVSEPNTTTITAVTSAITGRWRVSAYETASATRIATMNTAVATKMPAFSPRDRCGEQRADERHEQGRARIGEEEQDQRPHVERELEQGVELGFGVRGMWWM